VFQGNAIFHGTIFGAGRTVFLGAQSSSRALSFRRQVRRWGRLQCGQFDGEARFHGAVFQGGASFAFSVFRDEPFWFRRNGVSGVSFQDSTSFEHVQFMRHASFADAVFKGDVVLRSPILAWDFSLQTAVPCDQEQSKPGST